MCAVAKCKSKKFSLFSTFAVAFSCSFFVAFLSLKTTRKFFDMTNYFPQKRTLWPGQSLSSPRESSKSDPANFSKITRHTFALALTQKVNKCDHFVSSSIPFTLDFVRLSALENRMGELKVWPLQFGENNSTHFRTRPSTKKEKMWPFRGLIRVVD